MQQNNKGRPQGRNAPPRADAMVEALRGLGYTTATALADLVDNSISAGAGQVEVGFNWNGVDSWISIADDGRGMNDAELLSAMRLGDRNPLDVRGASDLGRFGLGLKTASFSQARRLTVLSIKDGQSSCLRWDLDVLASDPDGEWHLLDGPESSSEPRLVQHTAQSSGTVVLWEQLDRIVTEGFTSRHFLDLIDDVERHLAMIFHRYLDGSGPGIELRLNGKAVGPWDPFLSSNPATWRSPESNVGEGGLRITSQAFVLPHKDRLNDKAYVEAGGIEGWSSQQGFYIYRGRRLLVAGSWLGLGRGRSWSKDEAHRLARIRLDLPNDLDAQWKIDIRKSSAHPPAALRDQLYRLAEDARDRARKVFLHRAHSNSSLGRRDEVVPVWQSRETATGRRYRVDRTHAAVKELLDDAAYGTKVEAMLRVLEETIPVQRIWLEAAESGEHAKGGFTGEPDESVREVLNLIYRSLVEKKGMSPSMAKRQLLRTEPFDLHSELVKNLPDNISKD
ncbi:TPA: ATP-binding protein [Stenotrophomonas maltophilia]|nr:ATP-binding protein [Stenotrophomonas maltophilia]EJP78016.1 hypothetical protein A1OC_00384 [Stenotrophomonas maltophilia Ab55555]